MKRDRKHNFLICWGLWETGNTLEYIGLFLFDINIGSEPIIIFDSHIADSLERNDGNQFPVQLRVISVAVHHHRFLFDSMERRMTDLHMFLQFGSCPESLRT